MSGFSALDEEELYLLQDFASSIRPNFVVGEHVQQMINFLKELNTNRTEEKVEFDVVQHLETKDMINDALGSVDYSACDNLKNCSQTNKDDCKVSLIFGDLHMNNIILPKGNTWSSLKEIIETRYKEMEFNEIVVAMVMVVRTKYFRHNFDETCIDPAEILSGDTLLVDFDTIQQRAARNVERVYNSGLHVKNKFQFLALVVHSFMLDEGFVSIVELLESPHTLKRPWRGEYSKQFLSVSAV